MTTSCNVWHLDCAWSSAGHAAALQSDAMKRRCCSALAGAGVHLWPLFGLSVQSRNLPTGTCRRRRHEKTLIAKHGHLAEYSSHSGIREYSLYRRQAPDLVRAKIRAAKSFSNNTRTLCGPRQVVRPSSGFPWRKFYSFSKRFLCPLRPSLCESRWPRVPGPEGRIRQLRQQFSRECRTCALLVPVATQGRVCR